MRKHLFVCGIGRSGTTAMAQLLNLHDEIVIGVERYKNVLLKQALTPELLSELFSFDRFFSPQPGDTNVSLDKGRYAEVYDAARPKFAGARLIGDKVPSLYRRIAALAAADPDCKIIYMLREPAEVALSWDQRARRVGDSWPESNDFFAAVDAWNGAVKTALINKKTLGNRLSIVAYDDIFGRKAFETWNALQGWLEVTPAVNDATRAFLEDSMRRVVEAEPKKLDAKQQAFLEQTANMENFRKLREFAIGGSLQSA